MVGHLAFMVDVRLCCSILVDVHKDLDVIYFYLSIH